MTNVETELSPGELEAERLLYAYFRDRAPVTLPPLRLDSRRAHPPASRRRAYVGLAASLLLLVALAMTCVFSAPRSAAPLAKTPLKDVPPTARGEGPKPPASRPMLPDARP